MWETARSPSLPVTPNSTGKPQESQQDVNLVSLLLCVNCVRVS